MTCIHMPMIRWPICPACMRVHTPHTVACPCGQRLLPREKTRPVASYSDGPLMIGQPTGEQLERANNHMTVEQIIGQAAPTTGEGQ